MKRIFLTLIMLLTTTVMISSCGTGNQNAIPPAESNQEQPSPPEETEEANKETLIIYYTDEQALELKGEERDISYESPEEKYNHTMELLGEPLNTDDYHPLWDGFAYHDISIEDGTLIINASAKNKYNIGGGVEALAYDALTQTFFQFEEVEEIMFLVDGQVTDAMMGHIDTSKPFIRE